MTKARITTLGMQARIPFEAAEKIREILDKAREEYGADEWDDEDVDTKVSELVFESDPE